MERAQASSLSFCVPSSCLVWHISSTWACFLNVVIAWDSSSWKSCWACWGLYSCVGLEELACAPSSYSLAMCHVSPLQSPERWMSNSPFLFPPHPLLAPIPVIVPIFKPLPFLSLLLSLSPSVSVLRWSWGWNPGPLPQTASPAPKMSLLFPSLNFLSSWKM